MTSVNQQPFDSFPRHSQFLCNDRCQNILSKAVFEHFTDVDSIAALLLSCKSFQNSSFGANFLVNFVVDYGTIDLLESVLSPSSCLPIQFVPSLCIKQSKNSTEQIHRTTCNFVSELVSTKYFHLSLRALMLYSVTNEVLLFFFGSSTSDAWPQLHELTLEYCEVDNKVLEVISKTACQLRTVNLPRNFGITDEDIEHISILSSITTLDLTYCSSITDGALKHVAKLSNITSLNLDSCEEITDAGLEQVAQLCNITSLNLCGCEKITDAGLQHIAYHLSGITALDLAFCHQIADAGLEHLSQLSELTSLNLNSCELITDAGLERISKLPKISSLNLSRCVKISDAGLDHVAKLSRITSLILSRCNLLSVEAKTKLKTALPNCFVIG